MIIDTSVIVSSRVRLARNLSGISFSSIVHNTTTEDNVYTSVRQILSAVGGFEFVEMKSLSEEQKRSYVERYLISPALSQSPRGVLASSVDGTISVMINEEDHLREQCFASGFNLRSVYTRLKSLDSILNNNLRFSKGKFGFLTSCLTNVGTGMRASVMLFLPALCYSNKIYKLMDDANSIGLTVRGAYGEGSNEDCFLFQISNEVTYGVTESQIIEKVINFITKVEKKEREERFSLYSCNKIKFVDSCLRAYGILANCKRIEYSEFVNLATKVKLGLSLNILKADYPNEIDDVMVSARKATLVLLPNLMCVNEDERRAEFVHKAFIRIGVHPA